MITFILYKYIRGGIYRCMKYIITEQQLNDIPEGEPSKGKTIRRLIKDIGLVEVAEIIGGLERVIDLGYGGDMKWLVRDTGFNLIYKSNDGMNLFIHKVLADKLPVKELFNGDKELGKFRFGPKNDVGYAFTAVLMPTVKMGEPYYRVVGRSGDSGFGYNDILKKHILGKRYRDQIFKQIIDKYDLKPFMMEPTTIKEEEEERNIISDEKLSFISKTVTRAFKSIYPQLEEIVVTHMDVPHDRVVFKLFNAYVYVDRQLGPITEREIAESVGSFVQDNFDIVTRKIIFDSVHFHYQGKGSYIYREGKIFTT